MILMTNWGGELLPEILEVLIGHRASPLEVLEREMGRKANGEGR